MSHLLSIDQGTSSSRGIVFSSAGEMLAVGQREFDMSFPHDGWVEQNPDILWQTTLDSAREAIELAGIEASSLAAIGITNQRETTLLWDRNTGECLYNAIVWQDRRTADYCNELRGGPVETLIRQQTGLVLDPYFSSTKLRWLLENVDGARTRAQAGELAFGTVDSYLIWRLTNGARHVTDATNASRTQLYDIHRGQWSEELLAAFDIPASLLPEVLDCVADFGTADAQHFGADVPIAGVAGDQQAALVGQACFEPGMSKSTYGTGCFLINNTGSTPTSSDSGLLTTIGYQLQGKPTYAVEGSIFVAGQALKWLRDGVGLIREASDSQRIAQDNGPDTDGVYVVSAFTGLGAPHWQPDARAIITGLTLDSNAAQIVTATLASIAYQSHDLVAALARDGAQLSRLRVDGGMAVNDWFCQFLADIADVVVERPAVVETTALGAALLAAVGSGLAPSLEEAASMWRCERVFEPSMSAELRAALLDGWQAAVGQALALPGK
ncbi:MAG: glycerol kinase GlpK [Pseudomonadaceae bacterium]|nr:glycerol kinase GlpK [Pseudomonadaceae bacterium]